MDRSRRQWETLGTSDPYWAVLTEPTKKGGRWNPEEFFATGEVEIGSLFQELSSLGLRYASGLALDYGCGVGRLSRALAARFDNVVGVDISESMLAEARLANAAIRNIAFHRNDGRSLDMKSDSVDLIYSNISLQHSPRAWQALVISEFCRVLKPGGILAFETPSAAKLLTFKGLAHTLLGNRGLNSIRSVFYGESSVMEIHTLPERQVRSLLRTGNVTLIEARPSEDTGGSFSSFMYYATKR